jgi:hypothetical protein
LLLGFLDSTAPLLFQKLEGIVCILQPQNLKHIVRNQHGPYVSLRVFGAFVGSCIVPLAYLTMRQGHSKIAALICSLALCFGMTKTHTKFWYSTSYRKWNDHEPSHDFTGFVLDVFHSFDFVCVDQNI